MPITAGTKKVRVYNDNNVVYREKYKNQEIEIPPGKYIVMGRADAINFRGKNAGRKVIKNLRLETESEGRLYEHNVCMFCGIEFPTAALLEKHIETHNDKKKEAKKDTLYACYCGFTSTNKGAFASHLSGHVTSGEMTQEAREKILGKDKE